MVLFDLKEHLIMAQGDMDDFILPSRGALQRLKDDQKVDKEIDKQLSGLAASSDLRARLAESSMAQLPAGVGSFRNSRHAACDDSYL
jgi:hypothetical protein